MQRFRGWTAGLLGLVVCLGSALPAAGAGFGIFEQGAKGMGMAGAFTAQADDGSALFHNVAGIAFQKERKFNLGTTLIMSSKAEFEGAGSYPGPGATGEQEGLFEFPSHFYYVQPLNDTTTFGFGLYTPFGLTTEWKDKNNFPGRFLSTKAALRSFDLNPSISWQFGNLGVGVGAIARVSDVELERRAGIPNPFTLRVSDVANVELNSDMDWGYGYNVGILHKVTNSFSWGLSYRSKVKIDYSGTGRLNQISTGNAQLDATVARSLPVNQDLPMETTIEFPDEASLGFAFMVTPALGFEVDANYTGWSSFGTLPINFTRNPSLSTDVVENWEDAYNYRLGIHWDLDGDNQLRFGYVYDETPQPEEAMSPLLPDANRNGYTIGYGWKGQRFTVDGAIMYLPFDERTTMTNRDGFFGTYNTTAWLYSLTLGF